MKWQNRAGTGGLDRAFESFKCVVTYELSCRKIKSLSSKYTSMLHVLIDFNRQSVEQLDTLMH